MNRGVSRAELNASTLAPEFDGKPPCAGVLYTLVVDWACNKNPINQSINQSTAWGHARASIRIGSLCQRSRGFYLLATAIAQLCGYYYL